MAVKIGHASIDERGKAKGGSAGDQTGKEVFIREWYDKPWICVIRPISSTHAEKIAKTMEQACANDKIGYDQNQRTTLYAQAKACNWNLSKITTACETDCSALVAVCVNAAGISVSKDMYTGNEKSLLLATGKFRAYTDKGYIESSAKLMRGDILLAAHHTAIVLSDGSGAKSKSKSKSSAVAKVAAAQSKDSSLAGAYTTKANLNLRYGPGKKYDSEIIMPKGTKCQCYGFYTKVSGVKWLLVEATVDGKEYKGHCSSEYLKKA